MTWPSGHLNIHMHTRLSWEGHFQLGVNSATSFCSYITLPLFQVEQRRFNWKEQISSGDNILEQGKSYKDLKYW